MKMTFQNLLILGAIHPFSWEILHIMKKLTELLRQEGGFTPSLSHPGKISFGQGSTAVFLKISEI